MQVILAGDECDLREMERVLALRPRMPTASVVLPVAAGTVPDIGGSVDGDVATICAFPGARIDRAAARRLMLRGSTLLTVLPLCLPPDILTWLTDRIKRNKMGLGVIGTVRFVPAAARIKEAVESGVLGDVTAVSVTVAERGVGDSRRPSALGCQRAVDLAWRLAGKTGARVVSIHDSDDERRFAASESDTMVEVACRRDLVSESAPVPEARFRASVTGTLGTAECEFAVSQSRFAREVRDGRAAVTTDRRREFVAPPADPFAVELGLYLAAPTRPPGGVDRARDALAVLAAVC